MKEFIWANLAFKEEPKSNQTFEEIGANKKVQKSINVIMLLMVIIHMFLASKRTRKSKKIHAPNWFHNLYTIKDLFWGVLSLQVL